MAATFRTAPMGFNKKDVIEYIEKLVDEKNANIESAWAEYKALERDSNKQLADREEELMRERMQTAAHIEELQTALEQARAAAAQLEEEKRLLEERAVGSEQAFADLEQAMNELRASHTEELNAIYAERSALLDKKAEQIRALEAEAADKDGEIDSLRKTNLRLLSQVDELDALVSAYEEDVEEEDAAEAMPTDTQTLLAAFKTRFIEITGELSQLAKAILEAEKRETLAEEDDKDEDAEDEDDLLTFPVDLSGDDLPDGDEAAADEELLDVFNDLPDEEEDETADEAPEASEDADPNATRIEMTDYPDPARAPRPVQKKTTSVRDLLDRLRIIGDRLL